MLREQFMRKPGLWQSLALVFLCVALTCNAAAGDPGAAASAAASTLSPNELLVVMPTHHKRIGMVYASRSWRKGVQTHIVVDDEVKLDGLRGMGLHHNETFSAMPDLPGIPGSLRLVMSPLLAHRKYAGKYKWMLLGDDDTLFSLTAVMAMLREMRVSHIDPIAISDFLVHCRFESSNKRWKAPVTRDLRCAAATAAAAGAAAADPLAGMGSGGSRMSQEPTPPCMLPPERTGPPRFAEAPDCPPEGQTYFYGGAGIILSHGLLERLVARHLRAQPVLVAAADEGHDAAAHAAAASLTAASALMSPAAVAPPAAVAAKDDASFYAVVMSAFSGYGDTSMSEAWRRAGVGFTPPPPLPYQLRIPKHLMPQQGQEQEQEQGAQSRKLLGTPPLAPPSPPPHRLSCAKTKSTGAPPVECRRFGSLGYHMDRATPAEVLARHTDAAAASPEAFRLIVSAHLRPQHGVVDEAYLSTMTELGTLLAQDYEG